VNVSSTQERLHKGKLLTQKPLATKFEARLYKGKLLTQKPLATKFEAVSA
jgi:hypothetical protein